METIIAGSGNGGPAPGDLIKDTDTQNFAEDVIEASKDVPVIVDFWAPWCGPCKQLGPLLEKLVAAARGTVKLVKLNVDENQELAQHFRIQSIPAVFAFKDGRPVDGFVGALPESQIKTFMERLAGAAAPSPTDEALQVAKQTLDSGDAANAAGLFGRVLQEDGGNVTAAAGLARCAVQMGDIDMAKEILGGIPTEHAKDADVEAARSALELAEQAEDVGDAADLAQKVAKNENDHQARYNLALALYADGRSEEAIDHLLQIIKREREWNDEAARKQMLKIFEALGPTHELTAAGRRGLSAVLFS